MIHEQRHVTRLSLRTADVGDIQPAARLVEQALATASMPEDGRPGLLLIRRLELGKISLRRGSAGVAQTISERVRELRAGAVSITSPTAARAEAVYVRDDVEAHALALHHALADEALDAWFWPRIDRAFAGPPSSRVVMQIALRELLARRDAHAVVPAVVASLLDAGRIAGLLARLDEADGRALREVCVPIGVTDEDAEPLVIDDPMPTRWRWQLQPFVRAWGPRDARSWWLVAAALRARRAFAGHRALARATRSLAAHYALPDALARVGGHASEPSRTEAAAPLGERAQPSTPSHGTHELGAPDERTGLASDVSTRLAIHAADAANDAVADARASAVEPAPASAHAVEPHAVAQQVPAEPGPTLAPAQRGHEEIFAEPSHVAPSHEPAHERPPAFEWTLIDRPLPTSAGGLYFVLAVFERLGIEAFLTRHPALEQLNLAARVLAELADRLGIADDDPIRVPLQFGPRRVTSPAVFEIPAAWTGELVGEDSTPPPSRGHTLAELLATWVWAVEAWLRRYAAIELEWLVRRPAALTCTRTHLDLIFDLQVADVTIRRAALDLDPGWVPWFGRVVHYHYVHRGVLGPR